MFSCRNLNSSRQWRWKASCKRWGVTSSDENFEIHFFWLQQLGINEIFEDSATFPMISSPTGTKIKVSDLIQKCGIVVDEKGSEAFVATGKFVIYCLALKFHRNSRSLLQRLSWLTNSEATRAKLSLIIRSCSSLKTEKPESNFSVVSSAIQNSNRSSRQHFNLNFLIAVLLEALNKRSTGQGISSHKQTASENNFHLNISAA